MASATNARDGVRVNFEDDGGGGAPVVILGGFLDPIELVRRTPTARALAAFADELRLVFVDHRGHGRSDKPHDADAYAMPLRVADVVAVLDELQIQRTHLMGISWGGRLCFGVGRFARERVRSLIAIGQHPYEIDRDGPLARVVGDALEASKQRGIEALVEAFEAIAGRYPDDVRSTYLECDAGAMRAAWEAATAEGAVAEDLGTWTLRCLICAAEDDADFFEDARRAAAEIPNAEFVMIPGTDHLGVDTAPVDPVLPAVLRALRGPS
jgi:pimeloyl-ACP methyl ester carboxylesterase